MTDPYSDIPQTRATGSSTLPSTTGAPTLPSATGTSDDRSVGELLGDISVELSTLMRQEVELAKAELKQTTSKATAGAGMFAGAAVAALLCLTFLSLALWEAIGNAVGLGWSGVIVGVLWAIVGLILFTVGRKKVQQIQGLEKTTETVSKIPNAIKGHEEENR